MFANWCYRYIQTCFNTNSKYDSRLISLLSPPEQEKILIALDDKHPVELFSFDHVVYIMWRNGYPESIYYRKNDVPIGYLQYLYIDGNPRCGGYYEITHKDDWQEFSELGVLYYRGIFENGFKVGHWYYWYVTGDIETECYYKNGVPIRYLQLWYESGSPCDKNNHQVGHWKWFI